MIRKIKKRSTGASLTMAIFAITLVIVGGGLRSTAAALPAGRVYEMVSPTYKAGYDVNETLAVAPDGESATFFSLGVFVGSPGGFSKAGYLARRETSKWSTVPLIPPATLTTEVPYYDFSSTLASSMAFSSSPAPNNGAGRVEGKENEFLYHEASAPDNEADWSVIGQPLTVSSSGSTPFEVNYDGANANFCHVIFDAAQRFLSQASGPQLYDLTRECNGEPPLRLVGLDNKKELLSPGCQKEFGGGGFGGNENAFNAISSDGSEIFFTTNVDGHCASGVEQLFARLDGTRTIEVSAPLGVCEKEVPCSGAASRQRAEFTGANEAGTKVFFITKQSLVPGDTDLGNDLYMADIGCPGGVSECEPAERVVTSLVQVSHDTAGEADVQGVLKIAPDGSHVYFLARGVLGGTNAQGQVAVSGADNLYAYDSVSGNVAFIADLCSASERSGVAHDAQCPASVEISQTKNDERLWLTPNEGESQTNAGSGAYLVFATYGRLTKDDTDSAKDVYRYDAATGALNRVSVGEEGGDANGNDDAFDAGILAGHRGGRVYLQYEMNSRAISGDGSQIVFSTAGPLSRAATNDLADVYEWHEVGSDEGAVALVSSGSADVGDRQPVISESGRDIFFLTTDGLVPEDTDGVTDLYDARREQAGEGFTQAAASVQPCLGDACQGPLSEPAPLLIPGSVTEAPGDNLVSVSKPSVRAKPKTRGTKATAKSKKKHKTKKRKGPVMSRGSRSRGR